ncbi:MAG: tetratricopeptide repeat protein [Candidatus Omnitrophica bacterium]|nr:tetratricopeptide repeat protein [Candidatus Omnitrophota bacterium]
MKIFKLKFFLVFSVILFLSLPFFFFVNKRLAYYSYKEVVYATIINNIAGRERNPEKISFLLLDYFYYNLFTPFGATVVDKDTYNDLIRGIAWCDQRSWGLETFLGKKGINSRMLMTRNPEGASKHTVLEVFIGGKWRFFDPFYGLAIRNDNGDLASYEDICRYPHLFYLSSPMFMFKEVEPDKYLKVKDYFIKNVFYSQPTEPIIWSNPIPNRDTKHKIITKVLDFYIYLFGNKFSYLYQGVYMKYFLPEDKADRMFLKARNYDLFGRYQPAISLYKDFIVDFPGHPASEDAFFFLGVAYNKTKDLRLSIDILQTLLDRYPKVKWKRIALYYLGYDYELSGEYELAKKYYWQAINAYNQFGKDYLQPGELKDVRRLYPLLNEGKSVAPGAPK